MNILLEPLGFHCHRLLGSGGMGSVFLATDTKLQRRVAIKVLLPRLSGNPQFTKLFLKEAETVAKFGHENIVQIYAIHNVQGRTGWTHLSFPHTLSEIWLREWWIL